jgi:hypothetical protein
MPDREIGQRRSAVKESENGAALFEVALENLIRHDQGGLFIPIASEDARARRYEARNVVQHAFGSGCALIDRAVDHNGSRPQRHERNECGRFGLLFVHEWLFVPFRALLVNKTAVCGLNSYPIYRFDPLLAPSHPASPTRRRLRYPEASDLRGSRGRKLSRFFCYGGIRVASGVAGT